MRTQLSVSTLALVVGVAVSGTVRAQPPSFPGLGQQCQLGGPPPNISFDTPTASIANSFNYIVEVANSQIGVFERTGVRRWYNHLGGGPAPGFGCVTNVDSFFGQNPLGLGATRIVDTKVLRDRIYGRFCVIGMQQDSAFATGSQGLFVAWSNTANPLPNGAGCSGGGWRIWRTPVPTLPGSTYQPDFNGMGQTETHIIYSGILQPVSNPAAPSYTFYRYFRKTDLNAGPGVLPYRDIVVQRPTSEFAHAADSFDGGTNMYLAAALVNANALRVTVVNLGNDTEVNTTVPVAPFAAANGQAPQLGGTSLDTIDGRMQGAVLRNNQLYCCHTIALFDGPGGASRNVVRWYQIALNTWPLVGATPQVVQSGEIDFGWPINTFMPSIAVNEANTVIVAYSRSSSTERPSVAWSGRRSFDPLNTLPLGGVVKNSTQSYTTSNGTGGNPNIHRWGDWTSVVLDNGFFGGFLVCGPWAEYGGATYGGTSCNTSQLNHWETWIGAVRPGQANQITYGTGFPGTQGAIPTIGVGNWPRIGWTPSVTISNTAQVATAGIGLVSLSAVPAPGLPSPFGATLWVDPSQMVSVTLALDPVSGQFALPMPTSPVFVGASLFLQGAVLDPGAAQGFSATAGLQVLIGI